MADQYVNVNGVLRKAEPKMVVVDGVNRQVQNAFVVDNGVIRKCWDNFNPNIGTFYGPKYYTSGYDRCATGLTYGMIYDAVMNGYTKLEYDIGMEADRYRSQWTGSTVSVNFYASTYVWPYNDYSDHGTGRIVASSSPWAYGYSMHRSVAIITKSDIWWSNLVQVVTTGRNYDTKDTIALTAYAEAQYSDGETMNWSTAVGNLSYQTPGIGAFRIFVKNMHFTK